MTAYIKSITLRARGDESGTALMFIVLSVFAVVAMAGLAVDGGQAYAERRQMQNSADAAALAGGNALNTYLREPTEANAAAVHSAVTSVAVENGADPSALSCVWVDGSGTELTACSDTSPATMENVGGVHVSVENTKSTYFMKIAGIDEFSASAEAESQVMALRRLAQEPPFLACSNHPTVEGTDTPMVIYNTVTGKWDVNPAAVGRVYPVHGPSSFFNPASCGDPSNGFKGLPGENGEVPGYWEGDTGNSVSSANQNIAGVPGCESIGASGCLMILPVCPDSNGESGAAFELYCTTWALFRVQTAAPHNGNRHTAELIGGAPVVLDGEAGGIPLPGEARVIRLTD